MAAAAAGAAVEEGMEPRALQYEQTLVSEASRALRNVLPDRRSQVPAEATRSGGANLTSSSPLTWGN